MSNPAQLDPAIIAAWCRRSRAASGLPATITDAAVLAKVVTLALAGTDQANNGRKRGAPADHRGPAAVVHPARQQEVALA